MAGPRLERANDSEAPIGSRPTHAQPWEGSYRLQLLVVDLLIIVDSTLLADYLRFGRSSSGVQFSGGYGVSYAALSLVLAPLWLGALAAARTYEMRFLGVGEDEYKGVVRASWWLMAVIAVVAYAFRIQFARGYVAIALPVGTVLLLVARYIQRKILHRGRRRGRYCHRVLAIGGREGVEAFAAELEGESYLGLALVGVCLPSPDAAATVRGAPVLGSLTQVLVAAAQCEADTIAVTVGRGMNREVLRKLAWDLEGSGIDLVVDPELLDVAGTRILARPAIGLPFVHVDEPELSGPRQALKASVEWCFAALAVLLLSPLIVALLIAIRADSPGSPVFRQTRVGKNGREFTVFKLRTMHVDAESLLESLREQNEAADGLLFKMRDDPRITRVGRLLRKWSLDELPQLWNVLLGDMALVGPRPPLPSEVAAYDREVGRRLLVRPGITGLWQVSGRSDLSWKESVRLDLYYVENWSLALDAMIVWKTVFAVFRREGAY
ncbi:MAG TPA: sugar transferase [Mycobacteriales bacterium]|nr:sugar transferase [Mycobacteriales bacterium]